MLSIEGLRSSGLLRSLQVTQSNLTTALERLSTGQRINSAADDPAGFVMAQTLRTQMGAFSAQLTSSTRLEGMIDTAAAGVASQVELLQDIRVATLAAAGDVSDAARSAYQTEIDSLVADFDRIATTTSFGGRALLDGTVGRSTFSLGASGSRQIDVDFASTRASAVGQIAEVEGAVVTTSALAAGDLVINGVDIGASLATDDGLSTSAADASALAVAAAINRADTGVTATVQATVLDLGTISGGSFAAGDLTLNGVDIGAVTVQAGDSDGALANAINAVSDDTGITAELDGSGHLVLSAADGRNIVTAGNDTDGAAVLGSNPGAATHTASVVLTSGEAISISGADPASAGLTAGDTGVQTTASLETLDVASRLSAEAALRRVDAALRELGGVQTGLGAAAQRVGVVQIELQGGYDALAASRGWIVDADVAAETARLATQSLLLDRQLSLLAQANLNPSHVLDLLHGTLNARR